MAEKEKLLITGCSGFTGQYVKAVFESHGYQVYGLSLANPGSKDETNIVCDLLDREALAQAFEEIKPCGVVHLAGISFAAHENAADFYQVNTIGTQVMLDVLTSYSGKLRKVLLASSSNVYGRIESRAIAEDTLWQPAHHYAASKAAMEMIAQNYFDHLPICIVRPFNCIGPGQRPEFLVPKLVQHFSARNPSVSLGNTAVERDFIDVRDAADFYFSLFESDYEGETFNLCSGRVASIRTIIDWLEKITSHKIEIATDPALVRDNEPKYVGGDISKSQRLLGFSPKISLEDTLRLMLEDS